MCEPAVTDYLVVLVYSNLDQLCADDTFGPLGRRRTLVPGKQHPNLQVVGNFDTGSRPSKVTGLVTGSQSFDSGIDPRSNLKLTASMNIFNLGCLGRYLVYEYL